MLCGWINQLLIPKDKSRRDERSQSLLCDFQPRESGVCRFLSNHPAGGDSCQNKQLLRTPTNNSQSFKSVTFWVSKSLHTASPHQSDFHSTVTKSPASIVTLFNLYYLIQPLLLEQLTPAQGTSKNTFLFVWHATSFLLVGQSIRQPALITPQDLHLNTQNP